MGCKKSKEQTPEGEEVAEGATEAKIIVVFGADGLQGGPVALALKGNDKFKVRAVTKSADSDEAKKLSEAGAEVVQVDFEDAESVKKAVEGASGVFLITDYTEAQDKEEQYGKAVADAVKAAEVPHLVFYGQHNVKEAIGKAAKHFDLKAGIETYIKEQEIPYTFVRYAFTYESLLADMTPKKNDKDEYVLDIPMGDVALNMISEEQTGECIHQILSNLEEYKNKEVDISADKLKIDEYAAILTKKIEGKTFVAGITSLEDFAKRDTPGAEDQAHVFEYYQSEPAFDIELTKKLHPDISSFEQWVEANKEKWESALKEES